MEAHACKKTREKKGGSVTKGSLLAEETTGLRLLAIELIAREFLNQSWIRA